MSTSTPFFRMQIRPWPDHMYRIFQDSKLVAIYQFRKRAIRSNYFQYSFDSKGHSCLNVEWLGGSSSFGRPDWWISNTNQLKADKLRGGLHSKKCGMRQNWSYLAASCLFRTDSSSLYYELTHTWEHVHRMSFTPRLFSTVFRKGIPHARAGPALAIPIRIYYPFLFRFLFSLKISRLNYLD